MSSSGCARSEAGIDIEVISGLEEARLIHLGVLQAVPVFDHRLLLVDIGGGSTEVLIGERGETLAARSFKLGAVRLTDRFFPGGVVHAQGRRCVPLVRPLDPRLVRAGGSRPRFRGRRQFVGHCRDDGQDDRPRTRRWATRRPTTASSSPERSSTRSSSSSSASARPRNGDALPGLDQARADIIVAGALVLQGVAETFGITTFTHSDGALREGVLLDHLTHGSTAASCTTSATCPAAASAR